MSSALDALTALETRLDKEVRSLPILRLAKKDLLEALYERAFSITYAAPLFMNRISVPGAYQVNLLSYLVPLVRNCPDSPPEWFTDGFWDRDRHADMLESLVRYAGLYEILPEVHRGWYRVSRGPSGDFTLDHLSAEHRGFEEVDVALSEVSLPFFLSPNAPPDLFDGFTKRDPSPLIVDELLHKFWAVYGSAVEFKPFSDEGLRRVAGVTGNEFLRFRAAWMAVAEFCHQMALAYLRRMGPDPSPDVRLLREWKQWTSVYASKAMIESTRQLARLKQVTFEQLLELFALNDTGKQDAHGDGFFPPFFMTPRGLLFYPDAVRTMMSARNLVFAVRSRFPRAYDDILSPSLEHSLLDDIEAILRPVPSLVVVRGRPWQAAGRSGNFDLLVYCERDNVVLIVEAKAGIAPHGPRLVEHLEKEILYGIEQLARFITAPQSERERALAQSLGCDLASPAVVGAILTRTSFGTLRVWQALEQASIVPLTPYLLFRALSETRAFDGQPFVGRLSETISALVQRVRREVVAGWTQSTVVVDPLRLRYPVLDLNEGELAKARAAVLT